MKRSIPRTLEALLARTITTEKGCMEWIGYGLGKRGYPTIGKHPVSQLVLELTGHDMSDPKIWALHKCDNPRCINPDHLFPGTNTDNRKDFLEKKRAGLIVKVGARWVQK